MIWGWCEKSGCFEASDDSLCCLGWSPEKKPTLKGPLWWLKVKQHGDQVRPRGTRGALCNKVAENICFPEERGREKAHNGRLGSQVHGSQGQGGARDAG